MIKEFIERFKDKPVSEGPKDLGEVAVINSMLYGSGDFPKYDPDALKAKRGYGIYQKMMSDDQVKACVRFKQNAVLSRKGFFDVEEDKPEYEEMAEFFQYVMEHIDGVFKDKMIAILSAMINGFSISEKVYKDLSWNGKTYWGLKDIKSKPAVSFRGGFIIDDFGNIKKLQQAVAGKVIDIPIEKVIHFVNSPDVDLHYGESDLMAAYPHYYSKQVNKLFRDIFLERLAGGFIWGRVTEGKLTPGQETALKNIMDNVSTRMGAIVPGNVELNVETPKDAKAFNVSRIEDDKAIAKSMLVPNLMGVTEQGTVGAYSLGEIQMRAFFWTLDEISARLADTLNEQVFKELAIWNFGLEDFPMFQFEPISDDQKMDLVKTWGDLCGKAVTHTDTDEAHIRKIMQMPDKPEEEEPEEDVLPDDINDIMDELEYTDERRAAVLEEFVTKPWLKRVDFGTMKRLQDDNSTKMVNDLESVLAEVHQSFDNQVAKVVGNRSMGTVKLDEFKDLKVPSGLFGKIRKALRDNMQNALDDSYVLAKKELPKTMAKKIIRPGMDKTQTEKFLSRDSLNKTKGLTDGLITDLEYLLANAIKYDRTLKYTMDKIDADMGDVLPKYDSIGRPVSKPARLENIARTNISTANNEARAALFRQPEFKGFIQAFEYSAVLDSRTTDVCEALHGRIRVDWAELTPPNHFQCRSILIPVTVVDDWDGKEDRVPAAGNPMKGFD